MEFAGYGGHKGYRRLALGVAPVAFAWSTLALDPTIALVAQWAGFTSMWYADMRVTGAGWTPVWFSQYRFYLSVLIGTCIILTLAGESFFNPVIETSMLAASGPNVVPGAKVNPMGDDGKLSGTMTSLGELETVEGDSHYVVIKHKHEEGGASEEESTSEEGEEGESASEGTEKPEGEEATKDGEDTTKGDQAGDAKAHMKEVGAKQAEKVTHQKEGKAGEIKKDHGES